MPVTEPETKIMDREGYEQITDVPIDRRHPVGSIVGVVLKPGESLTIAARHGVLGTVSTREITEKGKVKRKTKKAAAKSENAKQSEKLEKEPEPGNDGETEEKNRGEKQGSV